MTGVRQIDESKLAAKDESVCAEPSTVSAEATTVGGRRGLTAASSVEPGGETSAHQGRDSTGSGGKSSRRRVLMVSALAALLAVGGVVAGLVLYSFGGVAPPWKKLEIELAGKELPVAWGGVEALYAAMEEGEHEFDVSGFDGLGRTVSGRLSPLIQVTADLSQDPFSRLKGLAGSPLLTAQEASTGSGVLTPIEAASLMLAYGLALQLDVRPCIQGFHDLASPIESRAYGVCAVEGGSVKAVLPAYNGEATEEQFEILDFGSFEGLFLGAQAARESSPQEGYRLFAAAIDLTDDPSIMFFRGLYKAVNDAVEFGIEDIGQALERKESGHGRAWLALILLSTGEFHAALRSLERAEILGIGGPHLLSIKGVLLLATGRKAEARAMIDVLEKAHPDFDGLNRLKAQFLMAEGKLEEARRLLSAEEGEDAGMGDKPQPEGDAMGADETIPTVPIDRKDTLLPHDPGVRDGGRKTERAEDVETGEGG